MKIDHDRIKTDITPRHSLIDEKLHILISNLKPRQPVTLRARIEELDMESSAVFMPDTDGNVDPGQQAPISGSYDWVHSMGLLWTLKPQGRVETSLDSFAHSPETLSVVFTVEQRGRTASTTVERALLREGVQRFAVDEDGLHGALFMPPGPGPFPAVMVLTGSEGGTDEYVAALLANHGYATLALAYFAYPGRPDFLAKIELEYFEKGLGWLGERPQVDAKRLAVIGGSRGGELTLLLASLFPNIKVAVAYVPSHLRWSSSGNPDLPAWIYRGKVLPYIQNKPDALVIQEYTVKYRDAAIPQTPLFLLAMEKEQAAARKAIIEVENANAAILLISGDDDQMWPSTLFSSKVVDRLHERQYPHPFEHLQYAGVGHDIRMPYLPLSPSESFHPVEKLLFDMGGTPGPQAYAVEDSWTKVLGFLNAHL